MCHPDSLDDAHVTSYQTSVWDALTPALTFPEDYSTTSLPRVKVYSMVHGGLTTAVGKEEASPLRPRRLPLGNHRLRLLPQTILRRRAPQTILPLRPPVPRLIPPRPRPPRRRPLLPSLQLPPPLPLQLTLVLARLVGWQSRQDQWCLFLMRAIRRTSWLSTPSWSKLVLHSLRRRKTIRFRP